MLLKFTCGDVNVPAFFAGLLLLFVTACSVSSVYENGELVQRDVGLFANIDVSCQDNVRLISTSTYGAAFGSNRVFLGISDDNIVCVPMDCRIVLFAPSSKEVTTLKRMLEGQSEICTASIDGENYEG